LSPAPLTREAVRRHYGALAKDYSAGANRVCRIAYVDLLKRHLSTRRHVFEIGAGADTLIDSVDAAARTVCDLTEDMIRSAPRTAAAVVADAQHVPFPAGAFDGVFAVNVLEHVPEPAAVLAETARVLAPGGTALFITPNGDAERLLDLLERLRLKLPEGPHRFLRFAELAALCGGGFDILDHRRFLAFPAGPGFLWRTAERLARGRGLFQYIVLRRR
jgi:SAM-dependent methyltransferase